MGSTNDHLNSLYLPVISFDQFTYTRSISQPQNAILILRFWLLPLLLLPAHRERTAAGLISRPASKRMEMIPASATPVISSSLSARTSVLNVLMETAAASSLERSLSVS